MEVFFVLLFLVVALLLIGGFVAHQHEQEKLSTMSPAERSAHVKKQQERAASVAWGPRNRELLCPHCQRPGDVRTKNLKVKKGISGGKATAAVLTGGVSLVATGLSRKEKTTQARCGNCGSTWQF